MHEANGKYADWHNKILEDINGGIECYIATFRTSSLELGKVTNQSINKLDITEKEKDDLRETIELYRAMLEDCLLRLEQINSLRNEHERVESSKLPPEQRKELVLAYHKHFNVIHGGKHQQS